MPPRARRDELITISAAWDRTICEAVPALTTEPRTYKAPWRAPCSPGRPSLFTFYPPLVVTLFRLAFIQFLFTTTLIASTRYGHLEHEPCFYVYHARGLGGDGTAGYCRRRAGGVRVVSPLVCWCAYSLASRACARLTRGGKDTAQLALLDRQVNAVITFAIVNTNLAAIACFGYAACYALCRVAAHAPSSIAGLFSEDSTVISLYASLIWNHFVISLISGAFLLWSMLQPTADGALNECLVRSTDYFVQSVCMSNFNATRALAIGATIAMWVLELRAYLPPRCGRCNFADGNGMDSCGSRRCAPRLACRAR